MSGSLNLGFCALAALGLMLSCSSAERQYFPQNTTVASWVQARKHCQVCFKELVTLTPENNQHIARGLTSEHWIGLRKRPLHPSDNSTLYPYHDNSTFWSLWANRDPLAFQNWYPGYPVFKSPYPRQECCSCSCTCPAQPTTPPTTTVPPTTAKGKGISLVSNSTSHWSTLSTLNTTGQRSTSFESECVKGPLLFRGPDPNERYIEDPCVAVLKFGAWIEKECTELLPYICYEDRFYGDVTVTDIKSSSARLSWARGPGNISHYRVEVNNGSVYKDNQTDLSHDLSDLEPGTFYSVQVFPVKCGRDLNPENQTFYTVPNKVSELQVVNQTEQCVSLKWTRPSGQVDLYNVKTKELKDPDPIVTRTENVTVCDLTSGSLHSFIVTSGVNDRSQNSEESSIDAYTKPAKVSNLNTSSITDASLVLSWDKPPGGATGYRVTTSWEGVEPVSSNQTVAEKPSNKLELKDLPCGTKITLSVIALANRTLEGERQTVVSFTKPNDISSLDLKSTEDTISANWSVSKGFPYFTIELFYGTALKGSFINTTSTTVKFSNLNSAANYTVKVFSVTRESKSSGFSKSIFTRPNPPRDPKLRSKTRSSLSFTWTPPLNTQSAQYVVTLSSSFWGQHWTDTVTNETTYTFKTLKSGTKYTFGVQTKAGILLSKAETIREVTDSDQRELTLSMVCSSHQSLLCESEETRGKAFDQLMTQFQSLLGDHIVWSLEKMDSANRA